MTVKKILMTLLGRTAAGSDTNLEIVMILQQERAGDMGLPSWPQVADALDKLHPTRNAFVILSVADGDYIQTTGGADRLTVEYRHYSEPSGKEFLHFVLGRPGGGNGTTEIESNVGPVPVHENEVLTLTDAKRAFRHFYETQSVPDDYAMRDVTVRFQ
jgi:hypothetical protein